MPTFQYDFRTGYPDIDALVPREEMIAITSAVLAKNSGAQYAGDLRGLASARQEVAKFVSSQSLETCQADELILTNGAIHAVDLVCRRLSQPNDIVVVESPTFFFMKRVFEANHLTIMSVPMLKTGLDLMRLEQLLQEQQGRVKILYTIPSYHNPTGVCTSAEHRQTLVKLAQKYDFIIVEDATYQALYFDAPPPPFCRDYDETKQHVITVGSFSKVLMPSLRLGWIWSTPDLIQQISYLKSDAATSALTSGIAEAFIREERLMPQIQRARHYYKTRRDALADMLEECLPDFVEWERPNGGFFLWLTLPEHIQSETLLKACQDKGLDYMPGYTSFFESVTDRYIRLCFTLLKENELQQGGKLLAEIVRDFANG